MTHTKPFIVVSLLSIFCSGCLEINNQYSKLPPGPWRAVLKLDPEKALAATMPRETDVRDQLDFEEVTEGELPFNFEVRYVNDDDFHFIFKNGDEEIVLNEYTYARDNATNKDTLTIPFPPYDSYLSVIFEGNVMEGKWIVPGRGNYEVDFVAHHGKDHRFTTLKKEPIIDLTGKWEVYFGVESDEPDPAIGEFVQDGNKLMGTFLTETGDYRFLEGTVQQDKVYLSCFDGAHMFLFEAKIGADSSLSGIFRNGTHFLTSWFGRRNPNFVLRSADSLTYLKRDESLQFAFPNDRGDTITLSDPEFSNRPKIIQILGTWCPNCLDETKFLLDYFRNNPSNVAIIGLAFERHQGNKAMEIIRRYREKLNIPYPILYAGASDKKEASEQMPMLNEIISYPTLIFLDKNNQVVRIHTGFTGPATSEYENFVEEFDATLKKISG